MIPMKRVGLLAGAATLTLTGGSFADTDVEAQNEELRARISELESRLVAVESQSSDSWLAERRAEAVLGAHLPESRGAPRQTTPSTDVNES